MGSSATTPKNPVQQGQALCKPDAQKHGDSADAYTNTYCIAPKKSSG